MDTGHPDALVAGARPSEVPRDREAQIDWLYDWWERIDDWIDRTRAGGPTLQG